MGKIIVGDIVNISYNPSDPQEAFLTDNTGKINIQKGELYEGN